MTWNENIWVIVKLHFCIGHIDIFLLFVALIYTLPKNLFLSLKKNSIW